MEGLLRDLRYGIRVMMQAPGFTLLAVIALALGIGSVTSMFSVMNGAVLKGLPFPEQEELMMVMRYNEEREPWDRDIPYVDLMEIIDRQESFEAIAGYFGGTVNVSYNGNPVRYTGSRISHTFLDILGVQPILGRGFTAEEDTEGHPFVILLGYAAWQKQFGGSPDVLGKNLRVNGQPATVVGVMPEGFGFPENDDVWVPLGPSHNWSEQGRNSYELNALGRLKDGVSREQAEAELTGILVQLADAHPEFNDRFRQGGVEPFARIILGNGTVRTISIMLAMAGFVLLIACANVANLLLARSTMRTKELAIRSSVGASRGRILTQLLTESVLLSSVGAILGVGLAYVGNQLLLQQGRDLDMPFWFDFPMDMSVLLMVVGVTFVAGVGSGLIPALRASKANINHLLKDDTRTGTSLGMKIFSRGLVITQVTISCIALVLTVLMARSVSNINNVDLKFDTERAMTARMGLFEGDHPEATGRFEFYNKLRRNLEARPEVVSASTYRRFRWTLTGVNWGAMEEEGVEYADFEARHISTSESVGPNYFKTMGIPLLSGKPFDLVDFEATSAPVAIINQSLAETLDPLGDVVGKRIRRAPWPGELDRMENPEEFEEENPWMTIVGVVPNMAAQGVGNTTGAEERHIFYPMREEAETFMSVAAVPAPGLTTESLIPIIRDEVARLDPNIPLYAIGTVESLIREDNALNRFISNIFKTFGFLAAALASIGIYGVMSFAVSQRVQEFGIRAALGALPARIRNLVMKSGFWQLSAGLVCGLVAAFFSARFMENMLFGLTPSDPSTYIFVGALFSTVALLACAFPAVRASRIHPARALRYE